MSIVLYTYIPLYSKISNDIDILYCDTDIDHRIYMYVIYVVKKNDQVSSSYVFMLMKFTPHEFKYTLSLMRHASSVLSYKIETYEQ